VIGFEVLYAQDASEAMDRIGAGGIDVVALDHYLASGTGLDLLARIRTLAEPPAVGWSRRGTGH
jgi:DNA-binding response OmpR family regulator